MLSSSAPSKLGTRVLTISQRASGPSLQSMMVAAPIARNDSRKSPRDAKKIASSPSAAPDAVYRCTPHAQAVRNLCLGRTRGRFAAAPDEVNSLVRLVVARPEVFFEDRHEGSARAMLFYELHRFFERHLPICTQERNRQRRRAIHPGIAMQIDAGAGTDQGSQVTQRRFEPLSHRVGAAVLYRSAHVVDPVRAVSGDQFAVVQSVQAQIVIILQIVNRSDSVGVLEPADVSLTWILAHYQLVRDYADGRSAVAAAWPRSMFGAFAEPINHDPNVTIRRASIPASSRRGRSAHQAFAWPRGSSGERSLRECACLIGSLPLPLASMTSEARGMRDREPDSAMTAVRIRSAILR